MRQKPTMRALVLCEGQNDYRLLSKLFQGPIKTRRYTLNQKSELIWMIHEEPPRHLPIVVEKGVGNLDENLKILISQMRSIPREATVLILRDTDIYTTDYLFQYYGKEIIETRITTSFPTQFRPTHRCEPPTTLSNTFAAFRCEINYMRSRRLVIHFYLVTPSLENLLHINPTQGPQEIEETIQRLLTREDVQKLREDMLKALQLT